MDSLAAQIIVDILNYEMDMPVNSVWLRDENKKIPDNNGLYIVVGMVNVPEVMSNVCSMKEVTTDAGTQQYQISQLQQRETIQIDILSRSNEARLRNVEITMALQSFYSQQMQEKNNFQIARNARSFVNASSVEGSSNINRYSLTFSAMVWYRKEKLLSSPNGDYYDDFKTRVDDEETIGTETPLIQFEINSEGIVQ